MALPMHLARAIHFDESDMNVYRSPARTGEWCISGGFEFSEFTPADLTGKTRQAFTNGWLGLETFGRVTFVAVTVVEPSEVDMLAGQLARHFVDFYGAETIEAALPVARQEIEHMLEMCSGLDPNTLLTVARELTDVGVSERFRIIEPQAAELEQFAVHGSVETPDGQ